MTTGRCASRVTSVTRWNGRLALLVHLLESVTVSVCACVLVYTIVLSMLKVMHNFL